MNSSLYKDLYFTYILAEKTPANGTIILLEGLPGNPSSKEPLMQKLAEYNYDVIFPMYEGTWKSKGEFLKRAPSKVIIELIDALKKGIEIGNREYRSKRVFVLGSSFGGGVALDIASTNVADKVSVTSPVISFRKAEGIETLENYLATAQSKNYRFDTKNWQKLLNDEIWSLDNNKIEKPTDILVIAGENDDQIKESDVVEFGKRNDINVSVYKSGHITLSKITEPMLDEILNFFSKQ